MEVYQALVAVEPTTLVVTVLNLFLQLYLIKRFFLDKILKILDQRRTSADAQLMQAESARQEAQSMRAAYEKELAQAKSQADQILDDARKTAARRSDEILQDAQQQVRQLKEKAAADIHREKRMVRNDVKNEISELAVAIAGKVLEQELDAAKHRRLVDSFIEDLGDGA